MTSILTLTNSRRRVVFEAFLDTDGTYSYRAPGSAGGWGLTRSDVLQRALDHTEYNLSAKPDGQATADYKALLAATIARRAV